MSRQKNEGASRRDAVDQILGDTRVIAAWGAYDCCPDDGKLMMRPLAREVVKAIVASASERWERCAACGCNSLQIEPDFDCAYCGSRERSERQEPVLIQSPAPVERSEDPTRELVTLAETERLASDLDYAVTREEQRDVIQRWLDSRATRSGLAHGDPK